MSRTVAIIPLRGSLISKTRLTTIFNTPQRQRLVWAMLNHVVSMIRESGVVDEIAVVTRDADAVSGHLESSDRCTILMQPTDSEGLNGALEFGRAWAEYRGFDAILVMPGDLPMVADSDVQTILGSEEAVVIAPDRRGDGTNAMLLHLASIRKAEKNAGQRFCFTMGERSSSRHAQAATRLGLSCACLALPGLELDVDTPDDWERLPEPLRGRYLAIAEGADRANIAGNRTMRTI